LRFKLKVKKWTFPFQKWIMYFLWIIFYFVIIHIDGLNKYMSSILANISVRQVHSHPYLCISASLSWIFTT
jgi:hypothetical protein